MTTPKVVDLAEVRRQRDRQAREDRARRDWLHKAVDRILDGPYESLKLSTETMLEAFIAISQHPAYWRRKEAIEDEQYARALRSRK